MEMPQWVSLPRHPETTLDAQHCSPLSAYRENLHSWLSGARGRGEEMGRAAGAGLALWAGARGACMRPRVPTGLCMDGPGKISQWKRKGLTPKG